jgi:anti-sigma factor RsiW
MTCEQVRSRLSWLLDGELEPSEAEEIQRHVGECGKCDALLAEMKACDEEIRGALAAARPAKGFTRRVVQAAGRRSRPWMRVVFSVAASFFIALGLGSLYVNTRTTPPLQVALHGGSRFHADSMGALRVFVTDARTYAPVPHAAVKVFLAGTSVGEFVTNGAGSIDGFFRVPDLADGRYPLKVVVDSSVGGDTLEQEVSVQREYRLMLSSDKPMYQPGQTIHLRALALNAFTLKPRAGDVEFEVADSKGNRVFSKKVALSEFGIASADLTLADELNLGTYKASVTASGLRQERTLEVAKYALPKFKLELEPGKESYRPGDLVRATVRATYFFGKPVRGRVQARLARELVSGELREDGTWEFQVPAQGDGMVPVEVTVTDTADHKETKSAAVIVSREPLKVVLYPEGGSVLRGASNTFYLIVSAPDGRPVKADLRVSVNGVRQDLTTDDLGVAKLTSVDAEPRLEWARDKAGNETAVLERLGDNAPVDFLIRLDKPTYKGGETMIVKLLGKPSEPVYVDVVKGGQLLLAKVIEKNEVAVDLPPDLFGTVQVLAYTRHTSRPIARVAYVNLPEGLRIRPHAAKETFRPGEEMPVDFEVLDKDGKPVQAALGLSVVDEALFGLVESKIASEKAWLSLAPELIDTRGFLKAEATAIYQDRAPNAQGFVSGNGRGERVPMLAQNNYVERFREMDRFVSEWNERIMGLFVGAFVLAGVVLGGYLIVAFLRMLATAKFSGMAILAAVVFTALGMFLFFAATEKSPVRVWRMMHEASDPVVLSAPRSAPVAEEDMLMMRRLPEIERPREVFERPGVPKEEPAIVLPVVGEKAAPARVREYFPETLFWQPQLITDAQGRARVTLPAADSITSWRMLANAVSRHGALGYEQANLRVFQDFFVDIDFPVALTKGDRVHVPVAVYNYLKEAQTVEVKVQGESWFELLDEASKSIALKPGEVSVVYFGLKVKEHGRKSLTVLAEGKVKDAIKRSVEVMEKGREIPVSVSERLNGRRSFKVEIPDRAIDGASVLFVRITPGMSDLVTGLEGMIRMPSGCFEQTLSSAYPNVALHAYLKESGQLSKETEAKLNEVHSIAVQKILSFEANGGGFGWYPGRESNLVLTAYGTMFLADLAKVYPYDRQVLDRTIAWLENRQDPQGRWSGHDHGSTWSRLSDAAIPSTAYVAWALRRAGRDDTRALGRAEEFLRQFDAADAYAAALIANAFPNRTNLDRLAKMGKDGHWSTRIQSWTRARDGAADLETTALAVIALANHAPGLADEGAAWLVRARDPWGAWGSTQPTVLALRALAATGGGTARDKTGARLIVNGKDIANAFVESDVAQSVDISPYLVKGANEIVLDASRRLNVQIAGRYYVPWGSDDLVRGVDGLNLNVSYDRTELKVGETVTCTVKVAADAFAMMAEVAIPPGCTVDTSVLEDLVRQRVIDKYTQTGRTLIFYLPGKGATFSYALKPRYPLKVSLPRSVAYEYYTPDRRVIVPPQDFEVRGQ